MACRAGSKAGVMGCGHINRHTPLEAMQGVREGLGHRDMELIPPSPDSMWAAHGAFSPLHCGPP